MSPRTVLVSLVCAFSAQAAIAHEFWIDPLEFQVAPGEDIVADIRVGETYGGSAYSYFPNNIQLFEVAQGDERAAVEGRMGDRPALAQPADEGLAVVIHVTRDYTLKYSDMAKFEKFVRHKDAAWTLDEHKARGLPDKDFREVYSRHAKSLVAVGEGAGSDRAYGLETEIVAGANPYTDDMSGGMPVTVLYQDAPRAEAQVEVFEKAPDGNVEVFMETTDADGKATIPVKPGHRYMVDSVVLREPSEAIAEEHDAVWESLWANLTFEVPEE